MKKIRKILGLALCIAVMASFLSIPSMACSFSVTKQYGNIATTTYYTDGRVITTYSWDNTDNHPSVSYSALYGGYTHSGTLYKKTWTAGTPVTTNYTSGSITKTVATAYMGNYTGDLTNSNHYI